MFLLHLIVTVINKFISHDT